LHPVKPVIAGHVAIETKSRADIKPGSQKQKILALMPRQAATQDF
jgi:hypothetical protein